MTVMLEVGPPFQWKPGVFRSRITTRVWWGWFALSVLYVPLIDLLDTRRYEWKDHDRAPHAM